MKATQETPTNASSSRPTRERNAPHVYYALICRVALGKTTVITAKRYIAFNNRKRPPEATKLLLIKAKRALKSKYMEERHKTLAVYTIHTTLLPLIFAPL